MTNMKSIRFSSETNQTQTPTNSFSMQILDSSVRILIKSWKRRQRWLLFFATFNQEDLSGAPWRAHLVNFLESTWVHVFSISLLIVDLIITILELSSSLVTCEQDMNQKVELSFHWIGIGITSLLLAKTMALLVGLGSSFFKHLGHVIDGVVAIGAIVLEAFVMRKGGGLLVVVSLWRVIRVVESVFELSDEAIEAQIAGIVNQFEALKEENMRLLERIHEKDNTIEKLKEDLDKCRDGSTFISSMKF
ncbi:voltage-gated hydrogen channel 1 [Abrus precatorius]|uniref:Voltage-gated hydrogen channel 1 n=1 Tax=Abrus precatorius TaxID=3816 RepID=A0A8B8L7X8_ABRPR|nr:voltage-gated hydrogen channel 1 [Abrus precatorius]